MPTSTYKKKSHKSKKLSKSLSKKRSKSLSKTRNNSVSKKHKNSKRKYSNKKNNMRGGSNREAQAAAAQPIKIINNPLLITEKLNIHTNNNTRQQIPQQQPQQQQQPIPQPGNAEGLYN